MDAPEGIVTKESPWPVDETVARFTALLEAKGLTVFAIVDHSGGARENGLELRDTKVVIFGSPAAGTPVMEAAPLAALDLPLKVLVWDDGGRTQARLPLAGGARRSLRSRQRARRPACRHRRPHGRTARRGLSGSTGAAASIYRRAKRFGCS